MPFIVATDVRKVSWETRKFIRSHVMLGKNQGKSRKLRHAKRTESPRNSSSNTPCSIIPGKVGSEISFIRFADAMEPYMVEVVLNFSRMVKKVMFPLEMCLAFSTKDKVGLEPMTWDAAYVHASVLTAQAYFDWISGRRNFSSCRTATTHASKALKLLRTRLSLEDEGAKTSDMTVSVVLALVIHALMMSDYESAKHHMKGLRKIVDLRGGLANFQGYHGKLLLEMLRCDIGLSLHTGDPPIFFNNPFWEPLMPYPNLPHVSKDANITSASESIERHISSFDSDLAKLWGTMRKFCSLMNLAAASKRRMSPEINLNTMASVMYRLLSNTYERGSMKEVFRLGLLAFCSHVFLRWQNIRLPYEYLSIAYKNCLDKLSSTDHVMPYSMLWVLTIGVLSVFNESDDEWWRPRLRSCIEQCNIDSWTELRNALKSFLWIDVLHDRLGSEIFQSALSIA